MKLPEFSVKRRVTVTMFTLIVIVSGFIAYQGLGLDMFPDIEFPTISIITAYSGASPEDIESTVTKPVEQTVASVTGVKKVTSQTMEGLSIVMVEFESGTNLDFAAQDLRDRLATFKDIFPEEIETPLVVKFDISQFPILFYGVTSDRRRPRDLKKFLEDNVVYRLERLEGVASVMVQSPENREILINVDRNALESSGLDINRLVQVLRFENLNLPAGRLTREHKSYLLRTRAEFKSLEEIRNLVVGLGRQGQPILLRQVASVLDTIQEQQVLARTQGHKGVVLFVNKQSGANTVRVAERVKKEIQRLEKNLPEDIHFYIGMDQSRIIRLMIQRTTQAGLLGAFLAMLLIYLFLRNIRPTLTIGLAIPVSIIATLIPLRLAGYTLNLLTLGGLALGIGMLVDNAIVVIENVFRHLEEGKRRRDAARIGASEVGMAITASTFTTLAVFLPMSLGSGIAGQLARGLSLSISSAILASLIVSLTLVPMVASVFFKKRSRSQDYARAAGENYFVRFKERYQRSLEWALHHRKTVLGGAAIAFLLSLAMIPLVGTEFMPDMDRSMMMLKVILPTGTALEETDAAARRIEDLLIKDPNVETVITTIGVDEKNRNAAAGGFGPSGSHEAVLMCRMALKSERDKTTAEIVEELRHEIPVMAGVKVQAVDFSSLSGGQAPIQIKILGRDFKVLKQISSMVMKQIEDIPGLRDIKSSYEEAKPEYHILLDRDKISRLGLSTAQVANTIQAATLGKIATRYRFAGEETDVRVKLRGADRKTLRAVKMIKISTPTGAQVPLMSVAHIVESRGPVNIKHENQTRGIIISANLVGRDLGGAVKDIKERLQPLEAHLPEGYFIDFGGDYDDMISTFKTLGEALLLAVLLVYMVMAAQFESLLHPFIIMFTVPLAFIGVVLAFLITGQNISLPTFMGFIMLTGIVVNNGIVLIDYVNQLRQQGKAAWKAVIEGSATRLRPVLITALTTIFGMLPMALSHSEGAEMRIPMAITVIGGLLIATLLTLYIVPLVYSLMERIKPQQT